MNKKIQKVTSESNEMNKVSSIKGAMVVLKEELIMMDKKR